MDGKRRYLRCRKDGRGVFTDRFLDSLSRFSVIDISATGIAISAKRELDIDDTVGMAIVFDGYFHEKDVKVTGRVVRKESEERIFKYGMEFIDLSQEEKVEIDEIMNRSCVRDHEKSLSNCEDDCTFLK